MIRRLLKNSSLRTQIFIPSAIALAALWASAFGLLYIQWAQSIQRANGLLIDRVNQVSAALDLWISDQYLTLEVLDGLADPAEGSCSLEISTVVKAFPIVAGVVAVDSDEQYGCHYSKFISQRISISESSRQFADQARVSKRSEFSGLLRGVRTEQYVVSIAFPRYDKKGSFKGAFLYSPSLIDAQKLVLGVSSFAFAQVAILDGQDNFLMRSKDGGSGIGTRRINSPVFRENYLGKEMNFSITSTGKKYGYVEMRHPTTGWRIAGSFSWDQLVDLIKPTIFWTIALVVLASAVVVVVCLYQVKNIARPVNELATRARLYQTEAANVGRQIVLVSGPSEVVDLSHSLEAFLVSRRVAEEKLLEGEKLRALGQLVGGIAHDVNNDLAVILGSVELIGQIADRGSRLDVLSKRIGETVRRSATLVQRMLAFSRKANIEPVTRDLGETVGEIIATLRRTLGGRVDIRVEPPAEPIWVYVDRAMLESCLINLSVNARDAMPEGGVLTFAVSSERTTAAEGDKDWAVLRVTDTGVGMSEEIRKRVFEPFFTTKPMGGGTGLGLSMVYGFVQQSGGSIEVESTPGQGTTFTVRFPRVQAAAASAQAEAPDTQAGAGHTVLVVEDNELVRFTLKEQLEGIGCRVVEAQNVAAAMACIEHDPTAITFILTDLDLGPGPTGLDLAEWVEKQGYDYPGAIVSGYLNVPNDQITQLGWIRIQKPVQIKDFAKLLSTPFAKGKKTEQPSIGQLTASS